MLSDRLGTFGAAALNARLPMPEGLVGPDGRPSAKRFAVYRNNVVVGLVQALQAAYPAVHRLVGDDFFRVMGAYYVRRDPPASPILLHYGESFPDFLGIFEPVAHLPWLPDVARLERARLLAFHAAEVPALRPEALAHVAPGDFGAQVLRLHPSVHVLTSRYPARTIWQANLSPDAPPAIDPTSGGEDTLILRPGAEVLALSLPPGGAAFAQAVQSGRTVMAAAMEGMTVTPGFDMAATLGLLLTRGAIIDLSDTPTDYPHRHASCEKDPCPPLT